MSSLKPGDKVFSKANPSETGEVCCVSLVSNTCRVLMDKRSANDEDHAFTYFITELEKAESK